jgi:hypothetical protein
VSAAGRTKPPASRIRLAGLLAAGALALAAGWFVGRSADEAQVPVERLSHVHGLEAPAWGGGDLYVATHTGLVRRDAGDGGWYEVGDTRHDLMGFRAHPSETGVLFGSGHPDLRSGLPNPLGFLRSDDVGLTWEAVALTGEADFHALGVQRGDGDLLYGFNVTLAPGLYRSDDGGRSWSVVDDGGALLGVGGAHTLDVHPDDPDVVLAGTPAGLLRSDDAGRSWHALAWDGVNVTAVRHGEHDARTIVAYVADERTGLMRSDDGGRSWEPLGLVLTGGDAVGYVTPHPTEPEVLYVGTYGLEVLVTDDRGATWRHLVRRGVPERP